MGNKMNGFFNFLQPEAVVSEFRQFPQQDVIDNFIKEATRNLDIGRKYIGVKYVSASILAAFAEVTGGDVPMSMFMGDLPSAHTDGQKLEDSLPILPQEDVNCIKNCDIDVYKILHGGRGKEAYFDIRKSPLSAYLYPIIGEDGIRNIPSSKDQIYPMDS